MRRDISIEKLISVVKEAGRIGLEGQKYAASSYKNDGSVLTEYDLKINDYLLSSIKKRYPDANVITEEADSEFEPGKPFTFAVDPIDGTDAFSQGMPGWAVSVGVLDENLEPVGGIIYAPKWGYPTGEGTFVFSNQGGGVYINNKLYKPFLEDEESPALSQMMISSRYHKNWDLKDFPGKLRNYGGAVLNITAVILYHRVIGALVSPCHIWDLAAAHGILKNAGFSLCYVSGKPVDYSMMLNGENAEEYMVAGRKEGVEKIRDYISSTIPS